MKGAWARFSWSFLILNCRCASHFRCPRTVLKDWAKRSSHVADEMGDGIRFEALPGTDWHVMMLDLAQAMP